MDAHECYAIFLTDEQAKHGFNYGYKFVKNHVSDAVKMPVEIGDRMDYGGTNIVYKDRAYSPKRDFIMIESGKRYYICLPSESKCDVID